MIVVAAFSDNMLSLDSTCALGSREQAIFHRITAQKHQYAGVGGYMQLVATPV